MLWTKGNHIKPPAHIPIYLKSEYSDFVYPEILTDEEIETILSPNELVILNQKLVEEGKDEEEIEEELQKYRVVTMWSFIPLLPPDEIMPHLTKVNYETERLKLCINELQKELTSIPRIQNIQRQIEALQFQIANVNPDPYQKWRCEKLKETP